MTDRLQRGAAAALLTSALALAAPALAGAAEGWEEAPALREAVARATAAGQPLVLKVTRRWCPDSWRLEQILASPEVARATAWFVKLAYDADAGEGAEVVRRYNVVAFPTLLVIGADGGEVGRLTGVVPEAELRSRLQLLAAGEGTLEELQAELARRPASHEQRLELGRGWALRGERGRAEQQLERAIAADRDNRRGLAAEALLVRGQTLLLRSLGLHQQAAQTLRALRRRFPAAPQAAAALLPLAIALHQVGQTRAALALLTRNAQAPDGRLRIARFALQTGAAITIASRHAQRAAEQRPRDVAAWLALARLQERAGRPDQAAASWARVVALAPSCAICRARAAALAPETEGRK